MSLPVRVPPAALLLDDDEPARDSLVDLSESIRNRRVRHRPSTVAADIWDLVEEMRRAGGRNDLTIEIARLEAMHAEIVVLASKDPDTGATEMLPGEALRLRMKLTKDIAKLKQQAAEMDLKSKHIVKLDVFMVISEGWKATLRRHLSGDPLLMQRISDDMGDVMRAAFSSVPET